MTDNQFDEVHEISKRLDRIIAMGKWVGGLITHAIRAHKPESVADRATQ